MEIGASPTAPNELDYAFPWLIMGQIKKLLDSFYLNKNGQLGQKPSHATVPLSLVGYRSYLRLISVNYSYPLIFLHR
jgi:hypothetical protein